VAERLIAGYEARLRKEPDNLRLVRSIAELYAEKKDFDKALEYYQRLASGEAADPSLGQAIAETHVKKFEHAMEQLDPNAPDYAAQAERIKAEKHAYLLADCQRRIERYPSDLQLRFELGQLYFQAGRISEAIQEFQRAQNNPHRRIQALYHLGLCFAQRGVHDLAARTFQNALKEKLVFDDEKKELIYALGCELEQTGKKDEAIEQFKLIYEVDIAYRDVATKVDAYFAAQ
jgi:tetratricopeptide (TPR) repeat protein